MKPFICHKVLLTVILASAMAVGQNRPTQYRASTFPDLGGLQGRVDQKTSLLTTRACRSVKRGECMRYLESHLDGDAAAAVRGI